MLMHLQTAEKYGTKFKEVLEEIGPSAKELMKKIGEDAQDTIQQKHAKLLVDTFRKNYQKDAALSDVKITLDIDRWRVVETQSKTDSRTNAFTQSSVPPALL
jgi:DNA primase catalytic subunit